MKTNQPVISIHKLSKRYKIEQLSSYLTLRDSLVNFLQKPFSSRRQQANTFFALENISFEVHKGEVIGVIGQNGSGKSTLLKILSRITQPTSGSAQISGKVSSLLEVGTGFSPELTGRENIYLNGAILGMTKKEITAKFDKIVKFAGIKKFLDTPVKRYSSGMYVRLAFAVAAHLDSEILLVDEVLAVGDATFQKKCLGKMHKITESGRTMLFVSHNMDVIQKICNRCVVLHRGKIDYIGKTDIAINHYLNHNYQQDELFKITYKSKPNLPSQINSLQLVNTKNQPVNTITFGEKAYAILECNFRKRIPFTNIALWIFKHGSEIWVSADTDKNSNLYQHRSTGKYTFKIALPTQYLKAGQYYISPSIGVKGKGPIDRQIHNGLYFHIIDENEQIENKSYNPKNPGILAVPTIWEEI